MKLGRLSAFPTVLLLLILGMSLACIKKADDAKITSGIQASFSGDSGLQGKQLGVQSENGVVTLSGSVDTDAQRTAASRYAAAAPGVKEVVNNLQVAASSASAPVEAAQAQPAPAPVVPAEPVPAPAPVPARKTLPTRHHKHDSYPRDRYSNPKPTVATPDQSIQAQNSIPAAAPENGPDAPPPLPPPPPPLPQKVTVPSGTTISVRLVDALGSDTSQQGQTFHGTLNAPLSVDGEVAVPAGYGVEGHVVSVDNGGKFTGKAQLALQLDRISVGGKRYDLQTDQYSRETKSRTTNTAEKVGAGSVIGAIIGGIAGGGKGAAIGAAAGGGVGGGAQAASKAPQVRLPSESILTFTLQSPLTVLPTTHGPDAGRPQLDSAPRGDAGGVRR